MLLLVFERRRFCLSGPAGEGNLQEEEQHEQSCRRKSSTRQGQKLGDMEMRLVGALVHGTGSVPLSSRQAISSPSPAAWTPQRRNVVACPRVAP